MECEHSFTYYFICLFFRKITSPLKASLHFPAHSVALIKFMSERTYSSLLRSFMTYLITGATGDVGSKVVNHLLQRGNRPRVFVRNAQKAQALFGHHVDIFVGDLAQPASLRSALEGVDELFLVNSGPQIPVQDELAAKAAKAAGVRHLVKLSSMDVQHGLAIGAWHELGEAAIRASGKSFIFVPIPGFMSFLLAWAS